MYLSIDVLRYSEISTDLNIRTEPIDAKMDRYYITT